MTLFRKFIARSWADRVLLLRAFALVCAVRLGLWVLPYRTVQRLVDRPVAERPRTPTGRPSTPQEELLRQRRIVAAVEAMSRRLLGDKPCLTQALVAQRLLREDGLDSVLRIGVAKDGRELLAHAWLERAGRIVIGGGQSTARYKPLTPVHHEVA